MSVQRTATELIRHVILRSGLNRPFLAMRSALGLDVRHLEARTLSERFTKIYLNRAWLNNRASGSLSGVGSELENTKSIRRELPDLLAKLGTTTLLDVGCGDFNWMSTLALPCRYIGADVVASVIESDARDYASPERAFLLLDASRDPLPPADTVLCREVLFHWSFNDIRAFLGNLRKASVVHLIATTDSATAFNSDIVSGDFRLLNLRRGPFRFPAPKLSIEDEACSPGRTLAVWRVDELPGMR